MDFTKTHEFREMTGYISDDFEERKLSPNRRRLSSRISSSRREFPARENGACCLLSGSFLCRPGRAKKVVEMHKTKINWF